MPSWTTSNEAVVPSHPVALRVAAAWNHLLRCHSSTILRHRLRRGALHLAPWRPQRGRLDFYRGLLAGTVELALKLLEGCGGGQLL